MSSSDALTPSEQQVLDLLVDGLDGPAMSERLGLSDSEIRALVQAVTVVGYGSNDRRSATATIVAIDSAMITLLNNSKATGQGGVCGDGGAPFFLGNSNIAVAVADGETGRCNAISWAFRNDTETARSFIDDFVPVP